MSTTTKRGAVLTGADAIAAMQAPARSTRSTRKPFGAGTRVVRTDGSERGTVESCGAWDEDGSPAWLVIVKSDTTNSGTSGVQYTAARGAWRKLTVADEAELAADAAAMADADADADQRAPHAARRKPIMYGVAVPDADQRTTELRDPKRIADALTVPAAQAPVCHVRGCARPATTTRNILPGRAYNVCTNHSK
jgi:hypothetical protein